MTPSQQVFAIIQSDKSIDEQTDLIVPLIEEMPLDELLIVIRSPIFRSWPATVFSIFA